MSYLYPPNSIYFVMWKLEKKISKFGLWSCFNFRFYYLRELDNLRMLVKIQLTINCPLPYIVVLCWRQILVKPKTKLFFYKTSFKIHYSNNISTSYIQQFFLIV